MRDTIFVGRWLASALAVLLVAALLVKLLVFTLILGAVVGLGLAVREILRWGR